MDDDEAMILERTDTTFTVMNAFPYTSGHVMAVPLRHVASLTELDADEATALMLRDATSCGGDRRCVLHRRGSTSA